MKKIYSLPIASFIIAFLLMSSGVQAAVNYTFTKTTGTYAHITGGTQVGTNELIEDTAIAIGFPFYFYGERYDTLTLEAFGGVYLTKDEDAVIGLVYPFGAFISLDTTKSTTGMRFKYSGSVGNRVLTLEWREMQVGLIDNGAPVGDNTSYQIAIYEGTNAIEFHYGPSVITDIAADFDGDGGPSVFLYFENSTESRDIVLDGPPANPTPLVDLESEEFLDSVPANGTIYRFTPVNTTGISETTLSVRTFPNPAKDWLHIQTTAMVTDAIVYDMNGRKMLTGQTPTSINIATLPSGIYFLELSYGNEAVRRKFVKR